MLFGFILETATAPVMRTAQNCLWESVLFFFGPLNDKASMLRKPHIQKSAIARLVICN